MVGSTRYHDIVPAVDRVEIGYTFYAARWQRSHVNTACKLLLLGHAFDTLGCKVVGLRTDNFNFRSQRAIEAIGGKRDGVIRHHQRAARWERARHGDVQHPRAEWPDVKKHLTTRLRATREMNGEVEPRSTSSVSDADRDVILRDFAHSTRR